MGFQQPPTLPDYAKLITALNESTVQKWNPALYQILKNLIAAVQQSQDVIINNAGDLIQNISSGGGITTVAVDPNGAILGDGVGTPLRTNPDGSTIQIVGNQLQVVSGLVAFGVSSFLIPFNGTAGAGGFIVPPNTIYKTISGVAQRVILPVKFYVSAHQDDNGANNALWSPTTSFECVYNMTGFPVIGSPTATVFSAAVGTHDQTSVNEPVAALVAGALRDAYVAKDVLIRTNNTINCVSTANKFIHNEFTISVAYILVPG